MVPDESLGRSRGARASAGVASPATRPLVPTPAGAHRWLGRRLRICKVSEHGARRYINAVIVFHDPSESHPFHVMHDDGTQTWLAVLDDTRVVHMIDPRTKRRVARQFTWLTPERVVAALTPARASSGAFLDARTPSGVGVGALATPAAPTIPAPGFASANATAADANPTQHPHHPQQQRHLHPPPRRAAYEKRLDPRMGAAPSHDWEEPHVNNQRRSRQHHPHPRRHPHRLPTHDAAGGSQLDGILEEFGGSPPGPLVGASGAGRGRGNTPANANGARAYVASPLGTADADDDAKASGGKRRRISDADNRVDDDLDAMARAVGAAAAAAAAVLAVDARADGYGSASASDRDGGARAASGANAAANPTPGTRPASTPSVVDVVDVDGGITPGALAAARDDASRALRSAAVTLRAAAILESRRPPEAKAEVDAKAELDAEVDARVRVRSSARRCDACAATLVDAWRACARCGAATCAECCEERRDEAFGGAVRDDDGGDARASIDDDETETKPVDRTRARDSRSRARHASAGRRARSPRRRESNPGVIFSRAAV